MTEFVWLSEKIIRAIHAELIAEHGGQTGLLHSSQLSSTLARPQNLFAYGNSPTLFDLAASYGYGFVKNHCFVDGNKRIAAVAIDVFLRLNGYKLVAEEVDLVDCMLRLASSLRLPDDDCADLASWIQQNSEPLSQ